MVKVQHLIGGIFSLALLFATVLVPTPTVQAQTTSQQDCELSGGTWNERLEPAGGTVVDGSFCSCDGDDLLLDGICTAPESESDGSIAPCEPESTSVFGLPVWYKYLDHGIDASGRCTPRIQSLSAILPIGLVVIEAILRLAGVVAVVMVIWGSFEYILSQGNPDKATSARKTLINAGVGLAIVLVSTGVITFIGGRLVG